MNATRPKSGRATIEALSGAEIATSARRRPAMLPGLGTLRITDSPGPTLVLERESPDGEEGYPGNLATRVTYRVRSGMELSVTFEATTDRTTCLNLTNHSFFNLDGARSGMQRAEKAAQLGPADVRGGGFEAVVEIGVGGAEAAAE